jgi:hypothetical protein
MVIAATAIVGVIALIVGVTTRGDEDADSLVAGGGDVAPLVVRDVPAGFSVAGATDLPAPDAGVTPELWLYAGDPDELFASGDLVVTSQAEDLPTEGFDGQITVAGRHALVDDVDGTRRLRVEVDEQVVTLVSVSLSERELVAAGDELLTAGLPERPPAALGELDLVGSLAATGGVASPMPANARGHTVMYAGEGNEAGLAATVFAGDDGAWTLVRWTLGPDASSTVVGGRDALVAQPFDPTTTVVAWRAGSTIVVVTGFNLDRDAVLAAAASLEPASAEEWEAAKAATPRPGEPSVPDDARAVVGPIALPSFGGTVSA